MMTLREEVKQLSYSGMISTGLAYRIVEIAEKQQATIAKLREELAEAREALLESRAEALKLYNDLAISEQKEGG